MLRCPTCFGMKEVPKDHPLVQRREASPKENPDNPDERYNIVDEVDSILESINPDDPVEATTSAEKENTSRSQVSDALLDEQQSEDGPSDSAGYSTPDELRRDSADSSMPQSDSAPIANIDLDSGSHPPVCICPSCIEERRQRRQQRNWHPVTPDSVVSWREKEGSRSTDSADSRSRGGGTGVTEFASRGRRGCGGLIAIIAVALLVGWVVLTFYEDILEFVGQFNQPSKITVQIVMTATPLPTPTVPATHTPVPTVMPTSTVQPTSTPEPTPTATATRTPRPIPTVLPAAPSMEFVIKVVSAIALSNGQVDFVLEVKNEGDLTIDEVSQVEMSVDNGAPELVNIIGTLASGESQSFAFTRTLTPGHHTLIFMIGDAATTVSMNVSTPTPTATPTQVPTSTPIPTSTPPPTSTPIPTSTPLPTNTPTPVPTSTPVPPPQLRHIDEKHYMLELINSERAKAGLDSVVLGDNIAAQLHAESALENCFTGHWGIDGLKPYMRYSLAGGYQSNGENGLGNRYCIRSGDGFRPIDGIKQEIREAIQSWIDSSGHRRNMLGKLHKKVNIGLAWDKYNIAFYQHFEGDYVEYEQPPTIENKTLYIAGTTKNGVKFAEDRELGVQLYYDPPPGPLTSGQLSKTYCYDSGRPITAFRPPLTGDYYYTEHRFMKSYNRCTNPRDFPADTPAPKPPRGFFQIPKVPPVPPLPTMLDLPWTTAAEWRTNGEEFSFRANLGSLISKHGGGVYTVMVWAKLDGQDIVISQYSIFYGVTPPDRYSR